MIEENRFCGVKKRYGGGIREDRAYCMVRIVDNKLFFNL